MNPARRSGGHCPEPSTPGAETKLSPPVTAAGEVHLWFAVAGEGDDPGLVESARRILSGEEIARMERLRFPEARRLFAVSHLLVRTALSRCSERPPNTWQFIRGGHGKPLIAPETGMQPLRFSLAHTAGMAVVAVSRDADVGVDVERTDRTVKAGELIRRFFSPEEAVELERLSPGELRERFFTHWTLKEAYIKALGRGLSHPLGTFGLHLHSTTLQGMPSPQAGAGVADGGCPSRESPRWIHFFTREASGGCSPRFALIEPRPPYAVALCALPDQPGTVILRCHKTVQYGEAPPLACTTVGLSEGIACVSIGG